MRFYKILLFKFCKLFIMQNYDFTGINEEIEFINSIYEGRYPSEAGLLPYGEPSNEDAERAVNIADEIYENIYTLNHR